MVEAIGVGRSIVRPLALELGAVVVAAACVAWPKGSPAVGPSSQPSPSPPAESATIPSTAPSSPAPTASPVRSPDPILVGAGDIASCTSPGDERTAELLDAIVGAGSRAGTATVFTAGDNAYPDGRPADFRRCYGPSWGRFRERTRPALGNHDWETAGAAGFFGYFGDVGAVKGQGWYGYELGAWHIVVLDSNCAPAGGCGPRSLQGKWLAQDLMHNPAPCTLAIWHHPRWSSGRHGSLDASSPFWDALYAAGADVVINGHDHSYERFAPQDPKANADSEHGIREFVIGTGGASLYEVGEPIANSEAIGRGVFGVLELTLRPSGYDWRVVPVAGESFTDSGSARCH